MKKNINVVCAVFLGLCVFFISAASTSLDGRAMVADENVLPSGLFAKTVGYLPGDSVSVTNPITGKTVEVLVIGSLDPSEGVAILLTPEAAAALDISKNSNNLVKLTKRSGQLDEIVSGTAVIAKAPETTDTKTETPEAPTTAGTTTDKNTGIEATGTDENVVAQPESAEKTTEAVTVTTPVEENPTPIAPTSEEENQTLTTSPSDEKVQPESNPPGESVSAETLPETEKSVEVPTSTEKVEDVQVPTTSKNTEATIPVETVSAENITNDEIKEESVPVPIDNATTVKPETVPPTAEKIAPSEDTTVPDETSSVSSITETKVTEPLPVEEPKPEQKTEDTTSEKVRDESVPSDEVPLKSEAVTTEIPETKDVTVPEESVPDLVVTESAPKVDSGDKKDIAEKKEEYKPILLSPSALNPPPETSGDATVSATSAGSPSTVQKFEKSTPTDNKISVETPSKKEVTSTDDDISRRTVSDFGTLKSGNYYVQIAVLSENTNIRNLIKRYGENYPIVLIPDSSSNSYQVLVGPLSRDEYGTVLMQFKERGFKDSFLRKSH